MNHRPIILIVDDDADDREIIKDAFTTHTQQAEYTFIENGDELMDYLNATKNADLPSLILLDLNMPGKDGRQALQEIKSNKQLQHIPTVILTTSSSYRDRQASYELGANCFVTKPDTFNKMVVITESIARLWLTGV